MAWGVIHGYIGWTGAPATISLTDGLSSNNNNNNNNVSTQFIIIELLKKKKLEYKSRLQIPQFYGSYCSEWALSIKHIIDISGQCPINKKGNYGAENDEMILKNHILPHMRTV